MKIQTSSSMYVTVLLIAIIQEVCSVDAVLWPMRLNDYIVLDEDEVFILHEPDIYVFWWIHLNVNDHA